MPAAPGLAGTETGTRADSGAGDTRASSTQVSSIPTDKAITRGSRAGTPGHGVVMAAISKAATAGKTDGAGASRAGLTGRPAVAGSTRHGAAGTRTAFGAATQKARRAAAAITAVEAITRAAVTRGMAGRLAVGAVLANTVPPGAARAVLTTGVVIPRGTGARGARTIARTPDGAGTETSYGAALAG
jgi:hypothetical protein